MKARRAVFTFAVLVAVLAGVALGTASASTIKWVAVPLGTHQFGHVRAPDSIVARAGPDGVGFKKGGTGCGCTDGPGGPVLFDVLNHRLLVWRPGHAAAPARTIKLTGLAVRDFALGRDGTIYLNAVYSEPPAGDSGANLWALSPSGKVRWRAKARIGGTLRVGPGGALYSAGSVSWTPLATSAGRPLSLAAQRRQTSRFQPLPGGMRLISSRLTDHELHFALADRTGRVVRAWRITSGTGFGLQPNALTPAVVGGALLVQLDFSRQSGTRIRSEHMILGLRPTGGTYEHFSLDAHALCCDDAAGTSTPLRVASDGRLYQLRTNPETGVTIARFSLTRKAAAQVR